MISRDGIEYEQIDDLETILNYLYNNSNGFINNYTLYRRNNFISDIMEPVDISSMNSEETIDMIYRKPLYKKKEIK